LVPSLPYLKLSLKRYTGAGYTARADHLVAKPAHPAKIGWIAFRFDKNYGIAVEAGDGVHFLPLADTIAAGIEGDTITTNIA
jgi:hypothetical protein